MVKPSQVYQGNKPDCAHCGEPIEDSSSREQQAGKVYHTDKPNCREAYNAAKTTRQDATSGHQIAESGDGDEPADDGTDGELELSDDDLARTAMEMGKEGRRLIQMADSAFFDLENRLLSRGATKFQGEDFKGVLAPQGYDHMIDDMARLRERLGPLLSQRDQDRAFPLPPPRERGVDHRVLNDLKKLGGKVAAIIDEERRSAEKRRRLKIEEIETKEEKEEDIPHE